MYCPAKERGMWFTRGRGTGPLQARGIRILKESPAPCDLAKTEQGSAVFASPFGWRISYCLARSSRSLRMIAAAYEIILCGFYLI